MSERTISTDRVAALEAAEDARALLAAYAQACDIKDLTALEALLAPGIVVSVGDNSWTGVADALGFFRDAWAASPGPSRHFVTNIAIERREPDFVELTALYLYVTGIDGSSKIGWGSYRNTIERHGPRLLFATVRIELELLVDLADGWAPALATLAAAGAAP